MQEVPVTISITMRFMLQGAYAHFGIFSGDFFTATYISVMVGGVIHPPMASSIPRLIPLDFISRVYLKSLGYANPM